MTRIKNKKLENHTDKSRETEKAESSDAKNARTSHARQIKTGKKKVGLFDRGSRPSVNGELLQDALVFIEVQNLPLEDLDCADSSEENNQNFRRF